jgi:hypothetical protein
MFWLRLVILGSTRGSRTINFWDLTERDQARLWANKVELVWVELFTVLWWLFLLLLISNMSKKRALV